MSTSSGRCFSNAAISGALQEVCPPTMAPCLVASTRSAGCHADFQLAHTRSIHGNHPVNGSSFDVVDYIVTCSSNEMAIGEYLDQLILCNFSALVEERLWTKAITLPENSSFSASYFSSLSQAFTLGATR